jgi:hypothetical protein
MYFESLYIHAHVRVAASVVWHEYIRTMSFNFKYKCPGMDISGPCILINNQDILSNFYIHAHVRADGSIGVNIFRQCPTTFYYFQNLVSIFILKYRYTSNICISTLVYM